MLILHRVNLELKMVKLLTEKIGSVFHYPQISTRIKISDTFILSKVRLQSALTQYFSTRWSFALMGTLLIYIVKVAPNEENARLGNKME